jgi:hypothetical protein
MIGGQLLPLNALGRACAHGRSEVARPAGTIDRRQLYRSCKGQRCGGPHLDEDELIREAQRGDAAAFEQLARRYEKPAFRPSMSDSFNCDSCCGTARRQGEA